MKQYNLMTDTLEVYYRDYYRNRNLIYPGCTCNQDGDASPEVVSTFSDYGSALVELSKHKMKVRGGYFNHGMQYYLVTEYYVQELEVDEDGDIEDWGDVCEYSEMPDRSEWEDD